MVSVQCIEGPEAVWAAAERGELACRRRHCCWVLALPSIDSKWNGITDIVLCSTILSDRAFGTTLISKFSYLTFLTVCPANTRGKRTVQALVALLQLRVVGKRSHWTTLALCLLGKIVVLSLYAGKAECHPLLLLMKSLSAKNALLLVAR